MIKAIPKCVFINSHFQICIELPPVRKKVLFESHFNQTHAMSRGIPILLNVGVWQPLQLVPLPNTCWWFQQLHLQDFWLTAWVFTTCHPCEMGTVQPGIPICQRLQGLAVHSSASHGTNSCNSVNLHLSCIPCVSLTVTVTAHLLLRGRTCWKHVESWRQREEWLFLKNYCSNFVNRQGRETRTAISLEFHRTTV